MRAVVERVGSARVTVEGRTVGEIGPGALVLVGISREDGSREVDRLAGKLPKLRIFDDAAGRMNEPLGDRGILCVSQFTLYADTSRGNRPSFVEAAPPEVARPLYERLCERLGAETGAFGERMEIQSVADGPVTLVITEPGRL